MTEQKTVWQWHSAARLLLAVIAVQLFFWLVFNPNFIQPETGQVEPFNVVSFEVADVSGPLAEDLDGADFAAPASFEPRAFDVGYHASRTTVDIPAVPRSGAALLDNSNPDNRAIYVNGTLVQQQGDMSLPTISYHGISRSIVRVPSALLVSGENTIDTVIVFDMPREDVLPPPILGNYDAFVEAFGWKSFLFNDARLISLVVGLGLTLFLFVAVIRAEDRSVLFWLFALTAAWSSRSLFFVWPSMPVHGFDRGAYYALSTLALSACWPIFIDRWTTHSKQWFVYLCGAIAALAALGCLYYLYIEQAVLSFSHTEDILEVTGLALSGLAVGRLLWHFLRRSETRYWEAALLVLLGLLMAMFIVSLLLYDRNLPYLTLTQPLFLFAFAAAFFGRNFRLFQSSAQINALLQTRLDQREEELALAYDREKELVRKKAHDNERRRIMRDMHDGLGSHLMSMLMMARRKAASHDDYAEGLQQVIDEMRLMIDSMDSVGESLTSALAIFRKRVMQRVPRAGFEVEWNDRHYGQLPDYDPRTLLQIFRILQEAVTNALKHSGGNMITIDIASSAEPHDALDIIVQDNGAGFIHENRRGRGLTNMQSRARMIEAEVVIEPSDSGTRVRLSLPENLNS